MNCEKYIGLDVHQATISVAVRDCKGKVVMETILETKASPFSSSLPVYAVLCQSPSKKERGPAWLYDLPKPHVAPVVVCNPQERSAQTREQK
jgi:hypothetical protein